MKLPFRAECASGVPDSLEVSDNGSDGEVILIAASLNASARFTVILRPKQVRQLRKALKKAARKSAAR